MPFKSRIAVLACACTLGFGSFPDSPRAAAADGEVDVSVFYGALEPHGEWVEVQPYGWAWVPEIAEYSWRPYSVGQWIWVEPYGWTWISDEPWAWATYHYGRWVYADDYGWVWLPGTVWAPAWVVYRSGDPWIGWAPMPPGPNWRSDAGFDGTALAENVSVATHAWTFVPVRYFAETDLRSRAVVSSYNPLLLQRTQPSTRFAAVEGGIANRSIDLAVVEKARGAPLPRRRLEEARAPEGSGLKVAGDAVVAFRPRIAAKPPAKGPDPRARGQGRGPDTNLEEWTARRQAALKAHLEAQRKALTTPGIVPAVPQPGSPAEDEAKRREEAQKALEADQKRLEALLERQRKRREAQPPPQQPQPPQQPPPPGKPDDGPGKGKDKDKDKDKDKGKKE